MNRLAAVHRFNRLSQIVDALAHASIISTRSRTVHVPTVLIGFYSTIRRSYDGRGKRLVRSRTLA